MFWLQPADNGEEPHPHGPPLQATQPEPVWAWLTRTWLKLNLNEEHKQNLTDLDESMSMKTEC